MPLALLIAYAVVTYLVWAWRLTADLGRAEAASLAGLTLLITVLGSLVVDGVRLHSTHAAFAAFGTIYACMLLASLGRPARMLNYGGTPVVATPKQFNRIQWAFIGLLLTSGVAIFLFAHQL